GGRRLRSSELQLASIPLRAKVWPLHAPDRNILKFEMEHIWFCMPGGYWLDPTQYDVNLLAKYQQNLGRQLEVNVGENWSDVDRGYYDKFIHLRADGRGLEQAIAESPDLFLKDPMPRLNFAGGPH